MAIATGDIVSYRGVGWIYKLMGSSCHLFEIGTGEVYAPSVTDVTLVSRRRYLGKKDNGTLKEMAIRMGPWTACAASEESSDEEEEVLRSPSPFKERGKNDCVACGVTCSSSEMWRLYGDDRVCYECENRQLRSGERYEPIYRP